MESRNYLLGIFKLYEVSGCLGQVFRAERAGVRCKAVCCCKFSPFPFSMELLVNSYHLIDGRLGPTVGKSCFSVQETLEWVALRF